MDFKKAKIVTSATKNNPEPEPQGQCNDCACENPEPELQGDCACSS